MGLLGLIAATVSYLYIHELAPAHGQLDWMAALTPLSVGGAIVAASMTLLADSRSGAWWQLAADVAVAESTAVGG